MTTLSTFRINQPPGSGYSNWDRSRRDIDLYSVASEAVECEAQSTTQTTYLWEMVSAPNGVSVTVNNPTTHTCNFQLNTTGGYLIRLTVNAGLLNESKTTLYIGVALENTGLCLPALGETNQDNSQSPYTGQRGSEEKFNAFLRKIDELTMAAGIGTDNSVWTGHLTGLMDVQSCLDVVDALWNFGFEEVELVVVNRTVTEADAGKILFVVAGTPPVIITLPDSPTVGFSISVATGATRMRVACQGSNTINLPNMIGAFAALETDHSFTGGKLVYNGSNIWGFISANGYWEDNTATPTHAFLFDGNVPDATAGHFASFDVDKNVADSGLTTSASAPANVTKSAAQSGSAAAVARSDHKHDITTATAGASVPGDTVAEGSATSLARSDHKHSLPAFGSANGTFCQGNDSRLSDARTPTQHGISNNTYHSGVGGAVSGHLASLDANGLPADSGATILDFSEDTFEEWIYVPVGDMFDGASPPEPLQLFSNGNGRVNVRAFSPSADTDLIFPFELPEDFGGEIEFKVVGWIGDVTPPASGEGVCFAMEAYAISMGDSLSGTFGSPRLSTIDDLYAEGCTAAYDRFITVRSGELTITGVTANDTVMFKLYRDVSQVVDDYGQDVFVSGVWIKYDRKTEGV